MEFIFKDTFAISERDRERERDMERGCPFDIHT